MIVVYVAGLLLGIALGIAGLGILYVDGAELTPRETVELVLLGWVVIVLWPITLPLYVTRALMTNRWTL